MVDEVIEQIIPPATHSSFNPKQTDARNVVEPLDTALPPPLLHVNAHEVLMVDHILKGKFGIHNIWV